MSNTLTPTDRQSSLGLSALAADIAMMIADVVAAAGSAESGAAETAGFLRNWAQTRDTTALSEPDSLRSVVERYGLTDPECDLLLLAGLAEEHEGLAATFRAMGPLGEPWPTLGVAALVLERKGIDRQALRRIVSTGQLCGQGIVRIGGNAPLFEQVLRPASGIWTALHGHRRLPDAVRGVDIGAVPPGLARWSELPAVQRAAAALTSPAARTVLVQSPDETVGLARCAALGRSAGVWLIAGRAKAGDGEAIRLLVLHAAAHNAVPLLVVDQQNDPQSLLQSSISTMYRDRCWSAPPPDHFGSVGTARLSWCRWDRSRRPTDATRGVQHYLNSTVQLPISRRAIRSTRH